MDKQSTLKLIENIVADDSDYTHDAAEVFEQMPVTMAELAHECSFLHLVRLAANDIEERDQESL